MPLEPLYGGPKFLSGRFWPISIRKTALGPDLVNFYPDAGFGLFFFAGYRPRAQISLFHVSCIIHLRYYDNIVTM